MVNESRSRSYESNSEAPENICAEEKSRKEQIACCLEVGATTGAVLL